MYFFNVQKYCHFTKFSKKWYFEILTFKTFFITFFRYYSFFQLFFKNIFALFVTFSFTFLKFFQIFGLFVTIRNLYFLKFFETFLSFFVALFATIQNLYFRNFLPFVKLFLFQFFTLFVTIRNFFNFVFHIFKNISVGGIDVDEFVLQQHQDNILMKAQIQKLTIEFLQLKRNYEAMKTHVVELRNKLASG